MIVLGPPAVRFGSAAVGVAVGLFASVAAAAAADGGEPLFLPALILLVGVGTGSWLAGRALRLGVVVLADHFLVRGLLWSRRIPYAAITSMPDAEDVTVLPYIGWWHRGRRWISPVTAFWVSPGFLAGPAERSAATSVRLLDQYRIDRVRRSS
ncbi:hypothetical protein QUG98_10690 [Curtobacterium sp. RHCJP20]|uniref:PH domain-containing protein n=1 Tax=Curtobacterium subtropicum TaxID=3055138 RepID=A0ABT7TH54_9MICO|nr:hypothetical protein [Curtobacterium subtropicum]MDM7888921.1 hypothetical protein [Curtobacterium subtropicum]